MFKFNDIEVIAQTDLVKATSHLLSSAGAYTLTRFKMEIERLYKEWYNRDRALVADVGITNPQEFDDRKRELDKKEKRTKAEQKEWEEANEKLIKLSQLRRQLENDDAIMDIKPMSWEDWHNLKQENQNIHVVLKDMETNAVIEERELFEMIEMISEGILWKAPEE